MDPNLLKNIGYFSVPNNQTANPVDQPGSAAGLGSTSAPTPSLWDEPALAAADLGDSKASSSAGAPSMSLESLLASASASNANPYSPTMSPPSMFSPNPRPIISPRIQKPREGHERKRSRLNAESTPFDSVDYWLQFDEDQQLQQQQKQQLQLQQQQQQLLLQQQQLQQLQQMRQLQLQQLQQSQQRQDQRKAEAAGQEESRDASPGGGNVAPKTLVKAPKPKRSATATSASEAPSTGQPKTEEGLDDSALEKALSDDDEGFSYSSLNIADQLSAIDSMPPVDIPSRDGLYTTPLSWEKPQMGLRLDSLIGLQTPTLSEAEQRRLIAIAMNPTSSMGGLGNNINSGFNSFPPGMFGSGFGTLGLGTISNSNYMNTMMSPSLSSLQEPQMSPPMKQGSKQDKGKEKPKSADRAAHNDIERKYRTNLKDRISELRDAVPNLRTISEGVVDDGEGSNQSGKGPKVSKGTVFTKATDYIHHLEKKNKLIMQQHQELSRRLQAFEQLLNATARPTFQMPNYSRALFDPRAFC